MLVFRREERKTISTVLINANNFNFLEEIIDISNIFLEFVKFVF
jgi:hypothetical protein